MNTRRGARLLEPSAVVLNLIYTVGYLKEWPGAFLAAGVGSALFAVVCWQRQLVAEMALWLFYIGMAGYGAWAAGLAADSGWPEPVVYGWAAHVRTAVLGFAAWALVAAGLRRVRRAEAPVMDAFTTVWSVVATYWMMRFSDANWLYWIVIDAVVVVLYFRRGMYWGAGLFVLYTLLAMEGWFDWVEWL